MPFAERDGGLLEDQCQQQIQKFRDEVDDDELEENADDGKEVDEHFSTDRFGHQSGEPCKSFHNGNVNGK